MDETATGLPGSGRWQVTTETSVYLLDLDANFVIRVPDAGAGPLAGLAAVLIASLRRDHESVPLLELLSCAVGESMRMMIDLRRDGASTLRTTTVLGVHVSAGMPCRERPRLACLSCHISVNRRRSPIKCKR